MRHKEPEVCRVPHCEECLAEIKRLAEQTPPTNENEDIDALLEEYVMAWIADDSSPNTRESDRTSKRLAEAKASLERWANQRVIEELESIAQEDIGYSVRIIIEERIAQLRQLELERKP